MPPPWLVARFLDSYSLWRERCARVEDAYGEWRRASGPDRARAFAVYSLALDREQRAASVHEDYARRVRIEGPARARR